jgi:hypothetical protein
MFATGTIVINPLKPEWGPGRIVKAENSRVSVIWRDLPERHAKLMSTAAVQIASVQSDAILDNLPPLVEKDGQISLPMERITLAQARAEFLRRYPLAFADPGYIGNKKTGERQYKYDAHLFWQERLGNGRFGELLVHDLPLLVAEVMRCIGKVNLLYPMESAALADALRVEPAARRLLTKLAALLESTDITEEVYGPYAAAVTDLPAERGKVATWPVATIMPFLAQPERHMFLKPEVTQNAANALGFNLCYKSEPNWLTYRKLLDMASIYRTKLIDWNPRDLIDVQSFFWVSCGGYD